ncbi:hypothetical protein [Clostridium butyricum]|uniref:Uncharacterized protein n=1 Tax=Clostridium butyricum E4 str. BoNT E BL5262 TaxID=632245 RepID=C4IH06_CLOBU|nr:hypothetical protein [Clostridium butyricum]EEP54765.1 hypothetical protein CLP_2700 [Clostridium butyricum E4 str. BoNT E BL5262]
MLDKVIVNGEDISYMVIGASDKIIGVDVAKGNDFTVRSLIKNNKRMFEVEENKNENIL